MGGNSSYVKAQIVGIPLKVYVIALPHGGNALDPDFVRPLGGHCCSGQIDGNSSRCDSRFSTDDTYKNQWQSGFEQFFHVASLAL